MALSSHDEVGDGRVRTDSILRRRSRTAFPDACLWRAPRINGDGPAEGVFVFLVLEHRRREVLHFNLPGTRQPYRLILMAVPI